jgi:hypothetical protein
VRTRMTILRSTMIVLFLNAIVCSLTGCGESGRSPKTRVLFGSEVSRAGSPDGQLDAVLIRDDGGGAGSGWDWYVYIVPAKSGVDQGKSHVIFHSGTLSGETLEWSQPHLLQIHYDIAHIEEFRNLWALHEIRDVGSVGEREYLVEIRLVPSSEDFSLLTPDGRFKPKK